VDTDPRVGKKGGRGLYRKRNGGLGGGPIKSKRVLGGGGAKENGGKSQ